MPRNSVARKGTDAHSTLQGAKLLASFRRGGEKQRRLGSSPEAVPGGELSQAVPEQAEIRGDAQSSLSAVGTALTPLSRGLCTAFACCSVTATDRSFPTALGSEQAFKQETLYILFLSGSNRG